MNSEATEIDMEVDGDQSAGWNFTERVEKTTNETPESREVVIVTDEEEETEKVPPKDEAVEARAAAIHTYQRRPAREETSGKRSEDEQPREAPIERIREDMNSPARSTVGASRRKRRLLIDEEPEEEEEEEEEEEQE
ncbi:neuromodulin-like [Salvia splendens]|uniref:neuromodulin-like n=1 Tax=Salvia splendens TaxID=180675 RepID=UPI001C25E997|nr:neuromodulin-like [Salvia splendens]